MLIAGQSTKKTSLRLRAWQIWTKKKQYLYYKSEVHFIHINEYIKSNYLLPTSRGGTCVKSLGIGWQSHGNSYIYSLISLSLSISQTKPKWCRYLKEPLLGSRGKSTFAHNWLYKNLTIKAIIGVIDKMSSKWKFVVIDDIRKKAPKSLQYTILRIQWTFFHHYFWQTINQHWYLFLTICFDCYVWGMTDVNVINEWMNICYEWNEWSK